MQLVLPLLGLIAFSALGCIEESSNATAAAPSTPTPAASQELTPTLDSVEVLVDLRVGESDDSTSSFGFVTDLEVDASGRMFVLDYREQKIKVFDVYGRFVRSIGRRGGGPAEFQRAVRLTLMRDSLWVTQVPHRISGFPLDNRPGARTFSLTTGTRDGIEGIAQRGLVVSTASSAGLGFGPRLVYLQIVGERGEARDTLDVLEVPERTFPYTSTIPGSKDRARTRGVQPFMQAPLWALARGGNAFFSASAKEGRLRILERSVDGDTLWTRELTYASEPVTSMHVQRYLDSISSPRTVRGVGQVIPDRRAIEAALVRPHEWPPVTALVIGVDSSIWLRVGGPNTGSESWWVVTRNGPVELVRVPPGFRLLRASRSHVWGTRTNADDVPLVERYRLARF